MENSTEAPTPSVEPRAGGGLSRPGDLFKKALEMWQAKVKDYSYLMLLPIGGTFVIGVLSMFFQREDGSIGGAYLPVYLVLSVAFWYLMLRTMSALFLYIKDHGKEQDIWQVFNQGNKIVWSLFFISLLVGIKVFLWALLLIIPGIIFSVYYSLSSWSLVLEGKKGNEALKRSKQLIDGYWWAFLGRNAYLFLFYVLVFLVLSIPTMFVAENSMAALIYSYLIQAANYLVMPIYYIFTFLLFKELLQIKGSSEVPERLSTTE